MTAIGKVALHAGGTATVDVDGHRIAITASSAPLTATPDEARRLRLLLDTAIVIAERPATTTERT